MESFSQCLDAVKEYCKQQITEAAYNLWIKGLEAESFSGDSAVLSTSSEFIRNGVETRYLPLLEEGFEAVIGYHLELSIIARDSVKTEIKAPAPMVSRGEGSYTFENFIIGPDNRFAHAAAIAVAANPSNAYNPLFIYGASGLGKTHLLYAIKNQLAQTRPELKVLYIGGDSFTNELIAAIKSGSTEPFHEKYRNVDVLLVDDVQFIGGKESTQEEFFHTFNALHDAHKQIVLTSDRPPKEIKSLEDRLRTRFEWGLIADVKPPDIETRISILYQKAEEINFKLPADVAEYIAQQLKNDIRQLEGSLKKLYAYYLMTGSEPTLAQAQEAISDIINEQMPWPATVDKIIDECSRTFVVSADDIRSNKQNAEISTARQAAMYVIREITGNTMEKIGSEFGGRNHATVVYAISKVEKKMKEDPRFKAIVEDIIKNCQQ
ncbi:MAG: chromosomal replication initiator protein DnaA [Oscillospiraceae bacterium]|nr:chromosomal replication initiator protein DnaA [Oscillospiraceae bacterium]